VNKSECSWFKPYQIKLPYWKTIDTFAVVVSGSDYELCDYTSHNLWANKKTGVFGRGLINEKSDERRVERTGLLGEMAYSRLINQPVNLEYKEFGEKHDFVVNGKTVDIKTQTQCSRHCESFIYAKDKIAPLPLLSDFYIFSFVEKENRVEQYAEIVFVGYIKRENISTKLKPSPIREASHYNYVVKYEETKNLFKEKK